MFLKLCKDVDSRTFWGIVFQSFGAEYEKERSKSADPDLGTLSVPLSDYLNERTWAIDIGVSISEIYAGVILLIALYVSTALL